MLNKVVGPKIYGILHFSILPRLEELGDCLFLDVRGSRHVDSVERLRTQKQETDGIGRDVT